MYRPIDKETDPHQAILLDPIKMGQHQHLGQDEPNGQQFDSQAILDNIINGAQQDTLQQNKVTVSDDSF